MTNNDDLWFERPTEGMDSVPDFFFGYIDTLTDGAWGTVLTISVFGISFLALNTENTRKAFAASSFTAWICSALFLGLGIGSSEVFVTATFALILSAIMLRGSTGGASI